MWKLFDKALGRKAAEKPMQNAAADKQDSGTPVANSEITAQNQKFGNASADSQGRDGRSERIEGAATSAERAASETQPAATAAPASPSLANAATTDPAELESKVKDAMRTVYDPEIPINIYELGLIYGLQVEPEGTVQVQMTLTAPSCPEAQSLPARVQEVIQEVPGVSEAKVELVWEPAWTPQRMSEAARLQLGIF